MTEQVEPISSVHIPKQSGGGIHARKGQSVRVVNVQGHQVADLFAFVVDDPTEYLSPGYTLGRLRRIYPRLGESLYSTNRRPLLAIREDTVGVHDLLLAACDSRSYEARGEPGHPNCRDNLNATLEQFNFVPAGPPDPVNLFQNTPVVDLDGHWEVRESPAEPGDYVTLEALEDVMVVVTACSVDTGPLNGGVCTDIRLELYD